MYSHGSIYKTLEHAARQLSGCSQMLVVSNVEFKRNYTLIGMQLVDSQGEEVQRLQQSAVRLKKRFDDQRLSAVEREQANRAEAQRIR